MLNSEMQSRHFVTKLMAVSLNHYRLHVLVLFEKQLINRLFKD